MSEQEKKPRLAAGLGLLAVQSTSCVAVIITVLVLRMVSGNLFGTLADYFRSALQQNTLATALHALWDGDIPFEEDV